jgi:hypothetical protein
MNGSQDALVIEQTDGSEDKSRKVSPAQIKQYVLGNSIDDIYSVMGQMGAKNLIPYPYTNAYRTTSGVTITEGSITGSCVFNGTSTGRVDAQLGYRNSNALTLLPSVQYCLSIKTDGSFGGNLSVEAWNKGTTTYAKNIARVTPSSTDSDYKEVKFSVTQSDINNYDIAVVIYGNSGNTFNNVTVYTMLRLASDTDNTYQPYAMTNKQLTETIGDLSQTGLTGDSVAEQLGTAKGQIADVTSGIELIPRKSLSANDENAFLLLAYADILSDMGAFVEPAKCITRMFTWYGHDHYIIQAFRVQTKWIYSFCFTDGKAYYIAYDCTNNSIALKKSFTLT